MNELFVLLDTVRVTALWYLGTTAVVAAGLAIFAGRAHVPSAQEVKPEPTRKAA